MRGDIPLVAEGVLNSRSPFSVFHLLHFVEAYTSGLDSAGVSHVHIRDIEVNRARESTPLAMSTANLDHATFDAEGQVLYLPIMDATLVLYFLSTER